MPRTLIVSGQLTVGDDDSITGSVTITGNTADLPAEAAGTAPTVDPAQAAPTTADGAPTVSVPDPELLPPAAPDVPESPLDPSQVADPAVPAEPATDPATVDPTTAGAEAGTADTTGTHTTGPSGPAGASGDGAPAWPGRDLYRDDQQHTPDPDVRTFQQACTDLGITGVGPVDGFFGPKTEGAVRELQERAGVAGTGVVDETTWALAFTGTAA